MNDTVLVTGGTGYIGARVCLTLAAHQNWNLRLTARQPEFAPRLLANHAEIVSLDLVSKSGMEKICRGIRCVIHLAGQNEIEAAKDPERALLVQALGTLRLLELAQKEGVERFIYLSTAHV